jgi:hypothetical protein
MRIKERRGQRKLIMVDSKWFPFFCIPPLLYNQLVFSMRIDLAQSGELHPKELFRRYISCYPRVFVSLDDIDG